MVERVGQIIATDVDTQNTIRDPPIVVVVVAFNSSIALIYAVCRDQ